MDIFDITEDPTTKNYPEVKENENSKSNPRNKPLHMALCKMHKTYRSDREL